ncbi:hypothetical protein F4802DRAFT_600604 [Xylaria palmicola]|nr:hypothetical protein F4802DRAFT_600604 [Xylaria palmicola]
MASFQDLDLPIALRRAPRRCASAGAVQPSRVVSAPASASALLKTPSKPRPKKRVRFSDLGPELSHYDSSDLSTGLTPMIKRSTLSGTSPKRHRGPTNTARRSASIGELGDEESTPDELSIAPSSRLFDDGGKRRTRQKELVVDTDAAPKKKTKARARKEDAITAKIEAEVQRLRAELAARDAEIERLHNETIAHDTGRIVELEKQIETLRTEIAQQQLPILGNEDEEGDEIGSEVGADLPENFYDWTLAARDLFSDSCFDDDDSRDVTMTDVLCSTPTRRRKSADAALPKSASASFPTPPCTSPTIPATPCSVRSVKFPVTPQSHVGVQASLPDPEKESLEAELASLRLELAKLTGTLETHAALQARLSDKLTRVTSASLAPEEDSQSSQPELEEHLDSVLQQLAERTTALVQLDSSLASLGFAGTEASEIIGSITAGLRAARLELEYLTPGEITLPLSSHGAEVLDLVLKRLRGLADRVREDEGVIDEYHALELSLRQQLAARVDVMDGMRAEQRRGAELLRERDDHIADLEVGLERLKGAAEGYRRDIAELEALVLRLEEDGQAAEATLRADLDGARAQLAEGANVTASLEARLADTLAQADELGAKLRDLQRRRDAEAKVRNKSYGAALALRDARVTELRREIYGINDSLRSAHATITKLQLENAGLERRVVVAEEGQRLAREAVDMMKAELEKVTAAAATVAPRRVTRSSARQSRELLTPEPKPGSYLSGDLARSGAGKGKKRRRYDSGLGMLDEDED